VGRGWGWEQGWGRVGASVGWSGSGEGGSGARWGGGEDVAAPAPAPAPAPQLEPLPVDEPLHCPRCWSPRWWPQDQPATSCLSSCTKGWPQDRPHAHYHYSREGRARRQESPQCRLATDSRGKLTCGIDLRNRMGPCDKDWWWYFHLGSVGATSVERYISPYGTDQPTSRRTEFFETATRFGPSRKLLYRFLRHLFPGVTLEPGE
jgi:hypothetical protein